MKKLLLLLGVSCTTVSVHAQLVVTPNNNTTTIANFLTGSGVTISNCTYVGDQNAIGMFSATNTSLGMNQGLILASGDVLNAVGPNFSSGAGNDNGTPGDADLDSLANCNTFNAAILEFDCVPTDDTMFFNFLFGSEEYPEYVSGGFNDVFAIYISGPNIPFQNMAWLPNSTIPVSVCNVNASTNASYYVDRSTDSTIQYDGTTTNLLATIPVMPDSVYHFKIAIADALDGIVDSGVLLEAGSFRCANPNYVSQPLAQDPQLDLYPLPAATNVNVQFRELSGRTATVKVCSVNGTEVLSQQVTIGADGRTSLDVSSLAGGLYMLEISSGDLRVSKLLPVRGN